MYTCTSVRPENIQTERSHLQTYNHIKKQLNANITSCISLSLPLCVHAMCVAHVNTVEKHLYNRWMFFSSEILCALNVPFQCFHFSVDEKELKYMCMYCCIYIHWVVMAIVTTVPHGLVVKLSEIFISSMKYFFVTNSNDKNPKWSLIIKLPTCRNSMSIFNLLCAFHCAVLMFFHSFFLFSNRMHIILPVYYVLNCQKVYLTACIAFHSQLPLLGDFIRNNSLSQGNVTLLHTDGVFLSETTHRHKSVLT